MELTILLSKVFGIYFILVAVVMILRRGMLKSILADFDSAPMMRFLFGAFMLIGGLFIVVAHQDWTTTPAAFITLIGWLTVLKALLYMTISNSGVRKWVGWFYGKGWYGVWGPLLTLALGLYLTNFGYGWY